MKKYLVIFSVLMSLWVQAQTPLTEAVDFTAKDVHGNNHHLFDILDNQNKYVLIDFFSVTCGPCQTMAPKMDTVYHLFGENQLELYMMAIDQTFDNAMVLAFEEEYNTHYPAISGTDGGGGNVYIDYQIPYYPSLILIASDHSIIEQEIPIPNAAQEIVDLLVSYGINTIGIKENEEELNFKFLPNPVQETLNIEIPASQKIKKVSIFQITGQQVLSRETNFDHSLSFDVSFLQKGIYLLSVEFLSGERISKKFIKE